MKILITLDIPFFQVIDDFVQRVKGTDITIISQEIFEHNPITRVENLKVIIFLMSNLLEQIL